MLHYVALTAANVQLLPILDLPTLVLACCLKIYSLKHEDLLLVLSFTTLSLTLNCPDGRQT